jgi:hypothetical protein
MLFVDSELNLTKEKAIMKEHFGKYAVILVDLKCDDVIYSFSAIVNRSNKMKHECSKQHEYLLNNEELDSEEKEFVKL